MAFEIRKLFQPHYHRVAIVSHFVLRCLLNAEYVKDPLVFQIDIDHLISHKENSSSQFLSTNVTIARETSFFFFVLEQHPMGP